MSEHYTESRTDQEEIDWILPGARLAVQAWLHSQKVEESNKKSEAFTPERFAEFLSRNPGVYFTRELLAPLLNSRKEQTKENASSAMTKLFDKRQRVINALSEDGLFLWEANYKVFRKANRLSVFVALPKGEEPRWPLYADIDDAVDDERMAALSNRLLAGVLLRDKRIKLTDRQTIILGALSDGWDMKDVTRISGHTEEQISSLLDSGYETLGQLAMQARKNES